MLVDTRKGKQTRSVFIKDSDQVILPPVHLETLKQRVRGGDEA